MTDLQEFQAFFQRMGIDYRNATPFATDMNDVPFAAVLEIVGDEVSINFCFAQDGTYLGLCGAEAKMPGQSTQSARHRMQFICQQCGSGWVNVKEQS